jgi:hypothetical protein
MIEKLGLTEATWRGEIELRWDQRCCAK